ncbi:PE family protein, partial [Mycobacterium nebraskense]
MPLTVDPATLTAAQTALTGYGNALATEAAGIAAATTIIAPAGADSISIQQAAIFSAFGTQLQSILAQGQDYASQFETNLGAASDTYTFTEAANAASAALSSSSSSASAGSGLNFLSYLLGGPSTSTATGLGGPWGMSGNFANIVNICAGNWASAGSDLIGLAGGGFLDTSAADAAGSA